MKTKIRTLIFFLLISAMSYSQVKVRPGVRLGVNISDISGLEDTRAKTGLNIGIFGNVHFSDFYELQLELSFSGQGAYVALDVVNDYYDPENDVYVEEIIDGEELRKDINYGSIGFMNKFFIPDTGLHLIAGPSIDVTHDSNDFFGGLFPSVDFTLAAGIGYEFPFGLSIEARYKQGLLDINDGLFTYYDTDYDYDNGNHLNTVIQFGLSYKFDF